jgi:crotonobetainyl-CoA:carnitine CoA-transferase CaiB-like acyl-CoA transferase
MTSGPLAGLTVIELAHIMSGPTCGMLLADMGADVIKVEKIPGGDDTRRFTPPTINGESAAFMMMNRNKRGIAVDLKTGDGRGLLRRLLAKADVVTENYRAGTMEKLGLGYDKLKAANPALIYCAISGFGRSGPDALKGGFDLVAQGMSGLMRITGEPGGEPVKVGSPVTDINAGMLAALGVVSAYVHRLKTGEGQFVDTSLFEAGIMQTYWQTAIFLGSGHVPGPLGSAHPLTAPYQAFETSDGWITLGASNQANYERVCRMLDAPELIDDPRFRDNPSRMANRAALVAILGERFRAHTSAELLAQLDAAGVPAGPVFDIPEMLAFPQTRAREMIVELDHPQAGRTKAIGMPIKFDATPARVVRPAPRFGEHTREVCREAGFSDAEIDAMLASGAIAGPNKDEQSTRAATGGER